MHVGDAFDPAKSTNLDSYLGKILRLNKDGTAPADNPFYDGSNGITARDYVYAYGFRNPFGGARRAADGRHYSIENGPSVDRLARILPGVSYGWNGTDASMRINAGYNWSPSVAPVRGDFVQLSTFGGSGFPASKQDHLFVANSGSTYATGPNATKDVVELVLDANGNAIGSATRLVHYTGNGKATAVALAAGPDGIYFSDFYVDDPVNGQFNPIARGSQVLRIRYVGT